MDKIAESYAKTNAILYDVGWGSDIAVCRGALPEAVFGLRIDPVQIKIWSTGDVEREVRRCVEASGDLENTALCCLNMDAHVPDENVRTLSRQK